MTDYFEEMGWQPLGEGQSPNHFLHFARLLRDFNIFDGLAEKLPPPASKKVVETIPNVPVDKTDIQCTVCLKMFCEKELAKQLPCNHLFHSECIMPWLSKTNSCPLCRHEMETDDEDYEAYRKEKMRAKQREADIENLHNSMFS
ncbi:hypothetical protein WA026_009327 [Henosepilachna vigintioctopunctata]|uniref:E3 ubiquitin-protein ligase RNF181 n=1 Tax=Henosepilachna vigintioctopunctata TaxID=420089 RepID=A0AAW1UVH9_9CUCU